MLVEVHILQNHAPSNLNRDDTGSPKEAIFGGYKRARISSQCLKRSIRRSEIFREALIGRLGCRTRLLADRIRPILIERGLDSTEVHRLDNEMVGWILVGSPNVLFFLDDREFQLIANAIQNRWPELNEAISRWESQPENSQDRRQARQLLQNLCREIGEQVVLNNRTSAVDIALFGRMIADNPVANIEASCQFAHAISTHKVDHEFDYFTAVDDLNEENELAEDAGAGMIGDIEFNSACYYKYFNVHVEGLVDNLKQSEQQSNVSAEGELREIAAKAICALIKAACRVTPTGRQNSFAAHQCPSLLWIEIRRDNLPVSYANAFCNPVNPRANGGVEVASAEALKKECEELTKMYGLEAIERFLLARNYIINDILGVSSSENLDRVLDAVERVILNG